MAFDTVAIQSVANCAPAQVAITAASDSAGLWNVVATSSRCAVNYTSTAAATETVTGIGLVQCVDQGPEPEFASLAFRLHRGPLGTVIFCSPTTELSNVRATLDLTSLDFVTKVYGKSRSAPLRQRPPR